VSLEKIGVVADGILYTGWTEASVTAGMPIGARTFQLRVTEIVLGEWHFPPNTLIEVVAGSDLLVDGVVEDYYPSVDEISHTVELRGRGRGLDFIDSSVSHQTGQFENMSIAAIAQALALPFGVTMRVAGSAADIAAEVIERFNVRRGSTAWAEMMRLLPQRGVTMMGAPDGAIVLTRANPEHHTGGLIQGKNITGMQAQISARDKFSNYVVIGQGSLGVDDTLEYMGQATDGSVPRFRLKEIIDQAETDNAHVQTRALWEQARAFGNGARANIIVPGFRDEAGKLWDPGNYVFVLAPLIKIEQDMIIEQVQFKQDVESGTTTTLTVVAPEAYGGVGGASKSDDMWRFGGGAR
jgi:prophage tail gpP-like protein